MPKWKRVQPDERVTLSHDDVSDHSKGNAGRLPLVEEIFNIDSILKHPIYMPGSRLTAKSTDTENALPSLPFDVVEEPVNMV